MCITYYVIKYFVIFFVVFGFYLSKKRGRRRCSCSFYCTQKSFSEVSFCNACVQTVKLVAKAYNFYLTPKWNEKAYC